MNKMIGSSSEQQQQHEQLALIQQRLARARLGRPKEVFGRVCSMMRRLFVQNQTVSQGRHPLVLALPNELFSRSVAFLHRNCAKQAMLVNIFEPFRLAEYFCKEHGTELEPRQEIYDSIDETHVGAVVAQVETNETGCSLLKCRDCELKKFDLARCPECDGFSDNCEFNNCDICHQRACHDCPKSDFETIYCERCIEEYCPECKKVWTCDSCFEGACEDCVKETDFIACGDCNERFCEACFDDVITKCKFCNKSYCMDCREMWWCEACWDGFCGNCAAQRGPVFCKVCSVPFCSADCDDIAHCDECKADFCMSCREWGYCDSCDTTACKTCAEFINIDDCSYCAECSKGRLMNRCTCVSCRHAGNDNDHIFNCFACDGKFAYASKVAVSCRSQKETFCLACMRE